MVVISSPGLIGKQPTVLIISTFSLAKRWPAPSTLDRLSISPPPRPMNPYHPLILRLPQTPDHPLIIPRRIDVALNPEAVDTGPPGPAGETVIIVYFAGVVAGVAVTVTAAAAPVPAPGEITEVCPVGTAAGVFTAAALAFPFAWLYASQAAHNV